MLRCAHLFFQQDEGWGFSQAVGVVVKTEQLLSHTACWDACWPSGCPPCTSAGIARLCQWGRLYVDVCASGCLKYLQAQWVHPSFRKTMLHSDAKIYYVFRECKEISSRVTFTHKRDKMYHFAKVNRFLSEDFAWYFAMKSNAEWDEEQIWLLQTGNAFQHVFTSLPLGCAKLWVWLEAGSCWMSSVVKKGGRTRSCFSELHCPCGKSLACSAERSLWWEPQSAK